MGFNSEINRFDQLLYYSCPCSIWEIWQSFAFGSFKYCLVAHITISLLKTKEMDAITPSLTIVASHVPNA